MLITIRDKTIKLPVDLTLLSYKDGHFKPLRIPKGSHTLRIHYDTDGETPIKVFLDAIELDAAEARQSGLLD
jgi:hypothetical protein